MNARIRPMLPGDREAVLSMMRTFYASPAVLTDGSETIFQTDFARCVDASFPFLEGLLFETDEGVLGYAMLAKSFSTEFGKPCVWIEDLFIQKAYRGRGIASRFFAHLEATYKDVVFRLEVEADNERAMRVYRQCGYEVLPYLEMIRKR